MEPGQRPQSQAQKASRALNFLVDQPGLFPTICQWNRGSEAGSGNVDVGFSGWVRWEEEGRWEGVSQKA
ncbi:unnamed protein product [Arctogadus glacialis]